MTRRCPITYESIGDNEKYSARGLRLLAPQLQKLRDLPFTSFQLRQEAIAFADKLSIQGVQPKLSARLLVREGAFQITERGGRYILKPPSADYPELPANEDVTMRMANAVGIDVPVHGMVYGIDGELTYFIKRFDRFGRNSKAHVEDFTQLGDYARDTKYNASMEGAAKIVDTYCTFPVVQRRELWLRTLFSFLAGNEDMHLKNFSLFTTQDIVRFTPAYDLLNTTIVLNRPAPEELALPVNGKKRKLTRHDLVAYFGMERLQLNAQVVDDVLQRFGAALPVWRTLLEESFLSLPMRSRYLDLLQQRTKVLNL